MFKYELITFLFISALKHSYCDKINGTNIVVNDDRNHIGIKLIDVQRIKDNFQNGTLTSWKQPGQSIPCSCEKGVCKCCTGL